MTEYYKTSDNRHSESLHPLVMSMTEHYKTLEWRLSYSHWSPVACSWTGVPVLDSEFELIANSRCFMQACVIYASAARGWLWNSSLSVLSFQCLTSSVWISDRICGATSRDQSKLDWWGRRIRRQRYSSCWVRRFLVRLVACRDPIRVHVCHSEGDLFYP